MAINLKTTSTLASNGAKILVYGQAGAGKTTLAATLPAPIILSAEGGLLSIQDANLPYIEVTSMSTLMEAYTWLRDSHEAKDYQSVALDSISEIAEVVLNAEKKSNKDPRAAYGAMQEQMADIIRAFRDLTGRHVYMSAKLEKTQDEMGRVFKVVKIATDVTEQVKSTQMLTTAVEEAQAVTRAASQGDLAQRIPLDGKSGPIADLCAGVNSLMETTAVIFEDVGRVFGALAEGDLTQRISRDYDGTFGQVKNDANATSESLAGIIEDVGRVFSGLASGDLTQRITRDAQGTFDQVKQDSNASCEKLASIIEEVRAAADALTGAANQVSATAQSTIGQKHGSTRPGRWSCRPNWRCTNRQKSRYGLGPGPGKPRKL